MPNAFETDGRSPSNKQLFVAGTVFLAILSIVVGLLVAKSRGHLEHIVRVSAQLENVGDGLPAKSDVKFRGVLVGAVSDVVPASAGQPNTVHLDLKPQYAVGIPDTVTARVVPSNIFAVSSVQLVDNGRGSATLRAGSVISEDQTLPTVLFQTTLNKFRALLNAVGREPTPGSIGVLTAVGQATQGRGDRLVQAGRDLNDIATQLNAVLGQDDSPSTTSALINATDGLHEVAPDLFQALNSAIRPMRTLAEKRVALRNFISSGQATTGTVASSFDNQTDRLINITTQLTPVIGVLADNGGQFKGIAGRMQAMADRIYTEAWDPSTNLFSMMGIVGLTPTRSYIRQDCPRYGALEGPSCQTAPEVPTAPALLPALASRGYLPTPGLTENRPNLAAPRNSIPSPDTPPDPSAPPLQGELPAPAGDPAPLLPAEAPQSEVPGPPGPPSLVQPQSFVFGGNVGPIGSQQEKDQLRMLVGGQATSATELLLAPLVRGATVQISSKGSARQ